MADSKISALATASALVGTEELPVVQSSATKKTTVQDIANLSGGGSPSTNDYRLTLSSGDPVPVSDITTASTLYWTPYIGNRCSLYTGSAWVSYSGGELSLALSSLTSGKNYDVFIDYNGGSPQIVLVVWTNDTTRATALTTQDGILVLTGNTDHRYVGTIRTISTSATCDYAGGTSGNVGGQRYVWNYYNRVERPMSVIDTTSSWSYNTGTTRQARANSGNKVEFVIGVAADPVHAYLSAQVLTASSGAAYSGMGYDSTSVFSGAKVAAWSFDNAISTITTQNTFHPTEGYHFISWNERGSGGGSATWYGNGAAVGAFTQSGMTAVVKA